MVACGGTFSEDELLIGEATGAMILSEEEGNAGLGDALVDDAAMDDAAAGDDAELGALPDAAGGPCDFEARRQAVLAEYDANGDGKLDASERQALRADLEGNVDRPRFARVGWRFRRHMLVAVRWAFDEDGDHRLADDERSAMVDALQARCEARRAAVIARHDANGDGILDETERASARAAFRAAVQAKHQALLAKYDANGNGTLELAEKQKMRADIVAKRQARRQALVAQYDADGDGRLSQTEALALKRDIQARIRGGQGDEE
jgi:hypothetical protein